MLKPLSAASGHVDLPALEHEVLKRWRDEHVFERTIEETEGRPQWVFYEGPPTANGMPGVHHVEARVFKDVFPRFKTMKGYHVPRKAGWDCHGLPVEVAVEKELGLSGKRDIEAYGVVEFNDRCRESVKRHVGAFEEMTERMGYWVDMSQAYWTMNPSYVESVWWSLKRVYDKGLLVRDYRVSPYCPRCGTALSDHEMGQPGVYETVTDPGVTVRFPITSGPVAERFGADAVDLLIWTTTPWTLVNNALVAAGADLTYVVARPTDPASGQRPVLLAEALMEKVLGDDWEVVERYSGAALERSAYRRPFDFLEMPDAHFIGLGDFVSDDDGTGLVHCSPTFGVDDFALCRQYGVPMINPIDLSARFLPDVPLVGGMFFKDADTPLAADLRERGLMFADAPYEHSYPHCWRCHTVLIYYALPSWYVRTTRIKDRMLEENERTNWYPDTIKHGRFGEWLRNNVDWALSRSRYWGTPLPLWVCEDDHVTCVGSLKELGELAGRDLSTLEPHRPYVDDIVIPCSECGGEARRVPDVIDAWYDSGSMPFAQWGAPYQNAERFENAYPANYICEAIDQTRGWFYSLMAVGTATFDRSSYENVVCLGHILAEDGRKMSKHLGNVLEPMPLMDRYGADALRWFMLAGGVPWAARRVGPAVLEEIVRKVLLTYWNTASFFVMYANAAADAEGKGGWTPERAAEAPPVAERPLTDRWALSELHRTVAEVDAALEDFDTARAGTRLSAFVDDLSNWYVRRSRRRFWNGPDDTDGAAAFATLYECLETLTRLMAPFVPFITEHVWDVLRHPGSPESVHLASWPEADPECVDERLCAQMALARRLVELGRAARADSGVRTRQPLGRAVVGARGFADLPEQLRAQVADELNVEGLDALATVGGDLVDFQVKPNFRALGKRFAKRTPVVANAITAVDPAELAAALRASGTAAVTVEGEEITVGPDDVIVTEQPRTGWAVAGAAGETVALDLEITPRLRRAGLAREVIRLVQDARKSDGLDITDRIALWWQADDAELRSAVAEHLPDIATEVLAHTHTEGTPETPETAISHTDPDLGLTFWLHRA